MGSSRNNGEETSMVRSPHNKKKKNSINDEESTQEGKFIKNDTNDEARFLQFDEEDPLKGCSSHNLPSERLSKGISKKSKKSYLLQICMKEIYKPVFPNQTKRNQTQPKWC